MKELLEIYFTFFKISSVTFGGGMAMMPILQREIVKDRQWVTDEEVIDYYALSQGLPGILAVNVAAMIGHHRKGLLGDMAASLGTVSPCILIITILTSFISNFRDIEIIQHAFAGITLGATALIFSAIVGLWKKSVIDKICLAVFALTAVIMFVFDISPVILIIISAVIGIVIKKSGLKA
ncbi:chromate transporter [Sedimentibacter sp.]|uniref:chromate transporter n=2 Tax=Sedimentibacter sp. TaxID=1960295 RepID=UPI0028B0296E|nr:chromate transporter [Sedimentibacter sp.]